MMWWPSATSAGERAARPMRISVQAQTPLIAEGEISIERVSLVNKLNNQ